MTSVTRQTLVLAVVLTGLLASFAVGALREATFTKHGSAVSTPLPAFKHIFVIVLENKSYDAVVSSSNASYLNTLAHKYGLAANYYGIRHPSLPNYLALIGGDTFGISSNCTDCFVNQPNLVDQLEAAGKSWKGYMESMPSPCFVGDAPPLYRQKHNPFIYFDDVRNDAARCNKLVPFTQFAADVAANALPDFVWITPNMCNDGHDCPISTSDAWLKTWVPQILASPAWQDQGALFITFDEGESGDGRCCTYAEGGRIVTLVISPLGKSAFRSDVAYDHYSLLRTIEQAWKLPLLGKANCDCSPAMTDFFQMSEGTHATS
jgi:phospholipase C